MTIREFILSWLNEANKTGNYLLGIQALKLQTWLDREFLDL